MFATRNIVMGTRILAEEPFFSAWKDEPGPEPPFKLAQIMEPLERLTREQRNTFNSLHCAINPPDEPNRFMTNVFHMADKENGIFLETTRINHSCIPNAYYAWNDFINPARMTLHAIRDIETEEEITVSYIGLGQNLEARRTVLREYDFNCDCPVCDKKAPLFEDKEKRRDTLGKLSRYEDCVDAMDQIPRNPATAEKDLMTIWALREQEGLRDETLGKAYMCAARCYHYEGKFEQALLRATAGLAILDDCLGRDSRPYRNASTHIKLLRQRIPIS